MERESSLMTAGEFASRIGKSRSWVYENKHRLQHRQNGGRLQFTEEDVAWYIESIKYTPGSGRSKWGR